MIALITYLPWGNTLLGAAPLGWDTWLFILPFALGMGVLEELRKGLARRHQGG